MADEGGKTNGHKVNGHKLPGLSPLFGATGGRVAGSESLPFDLEATQRALTPVQAEIPKDAFTAGILGTTRAGGGILIGSGNLVLTIGYLVVEAQSVAVTDSRGRPVEAEVIAYDFESGFGLVRALSSLGRPLLNFGTVHDLEVGTSVVASCGGAETLIQQVADKRGFTGYWEYRLDEAIFTTPAHPNWGGAALVGMDGLLYGVGSLYVEDAAPGQDKSVGNMFVPIDLLEPVLDDLLVNGRRATPPRPWLGVYAAERMGHLVIMGVAQGGPAVVAGLDQGDIVLRVGATAIGSLDEFYTAVWGFGEAGVVLPLTVMRDGRVFETSVRSADRDSFLKIPRWTR